ncbi:MAG: hypothetical protein LUC31_02570 [Coprobacillus sp.]|nr:hypothetical protein [Coprobacillus sp.]
MNFNIINTEVYGLDKSIKASGNPMRTSFDRTEVTDKDYKRAINLGNQRNGEGHDNYLKGIIVQMDVTAPLYWWKQAQRYHWFDFVSSQSTMHCLMKFDVASQCVDETSPKAISVVQDLISEYNAIEDAEEKALKWREVVASLPCGFCLGATMTTNYQQLKTMYLQRRYHKLNEWHVFCAWCEQLPHFIELTGVDKL